jgi:hypothetical protein
MPRFSSLLRRLAASILPPSVLARLYQWRARPLFAQYEGKTPETVFTDIYQKNSWNGRESVSGPGSDLDQTRAVRDQLPALLHELNIESMLDAPCGDFHWMKLVNLSGVQYLGGDIVAKLIEDNHSKYGSTSVSFRHIDIVRDELPRVDLILCRDCLIHLSFEHTRAALLNFKRSGSKYLLSTSYPRCRWNSDIVTGGVRSINLRLKPFDFPPPLKTITESTPFEQLADNPELERILGLWSLHDLLD